MTLDEELDLLKDNIRRLKIEYEIFFNGASKKPPLDLRSRVEFTLKKYSDTQRLTPHQRFQYNALAAKFSVFSDLWRTRMRSREEGTDRRSQKADSKPVSAPAPASEREVLYEEVVFKPEQEHDKILRLFEALKEFKQTYHDPSSLPSLESFERFIEQKTHYLKEARKCDCVSFLVVWVQGQVRFHAVPVSKPVDTASQSGNS
jgi:hypothetical protein